MSQKTSGKNFNRNPWYNPATDKLAFSCMQDGSSTSDIFTMFDNKGKALSQITESSDAYEENPSFNKDGSKIVYNKIQNTYYRKVNWAGMLFGFGVSTVIVQNSDIWMKDMKTGETTLLSNGYQPSFSPDGKRIVFQSSKKDKKDADLYVVDTDGNNLVQLTVNKSYDGQPYWTTDGYIYFVSDRGNDPGNYQIWRFKYE